MKRAIAAAEVVLISPAVLFMAALFVRNLQPPALEPARTAERIVMWYSSSPPLCLWVFLMTLPLAVFVAGCATLLREWQRDAALRDAARQTLAVVRAQIATLLISVATLTAGGILAIVALHALSD